MRQAVILAGGKGTRLAAKLGGLPKPLVPVCGVPLLQRQIEDLRAQGFDRVLVLVNHRAEAIRDFIGSHADFGIAIDIVDDGEPRGTAGAVLAAQARLADRFLVMYGDTLVGVDLQAFWQAHEQSGADATLFLHPNDHPADSDLVEVDADGRIQRFWPYPHDASAYRRNLVNAALYVVERAALARVADLPQPADFAKDVFPALLAARRHLQGYESFEYIKDLGTPARLEQGETALSSGLVDRARLDRPQHAVFIDRDGTLNRPAGFIARPDDLHLYPFAPGAVKALHAAEYRTIVITNQPVVARGDCSLEELALIHAKLESELGRAGAFLDGLHVCPHHPDGGYAGERPELKIRCDCRKPGTAMIEAARRRFNVDLAASWMVGDTTVDMLCARRAGLRSILVETGEGGRDGKYDAAPDFICADIAAAATFITRVYPDLVRRLSRAITLAQPGDTLVVTGNDDAERRHLAAAFVCEMRAKIPHVPAIRASATGEEHIVLQAEAGTVGRTIILQARSGCVDLRVPLGRTARSLVA